MTTPGHSTDRPIAHPTAWLSAAENPKVSADRGGLRVGNTSKPRDISQTKARVSNRRLDQVAASLSPRDWQVLKSVAGHRFLTTTHIEALHFTDHASQSAGARGCRRVLYRLANLGVLSHLDRRIGGVRAGSASYVWRIGVVGERLLRRASGENTRRRFHEPSERFLGHCLAIADLTVTLRRSERHQELELLRLEFEPDCWRDYLGLGGERRVLQPDLYLVSAAGQFEDHWFIEVDLGTEHLPTVLKKCRQYLDYRSSGQAVRDAGVFPLVLWIATKPDRAVRIADALDSDERLHASGVFRVATPGTVLEQLVGMQS